MLHAYQIYTVQYSVHDIRLHSDRVPNLNALGLYVLNAVCRKQNYSI